MQIQTHQAVSLYFMLHELICLYNYSQKYDLWIENQTQTCTYFPYCLNLKLLHQTFPSLYILASLNKHHLCLYLQSLQQQFYMPSFLTLFLTFHNSAVDKINARTQCYIAQDGMSCGWVSFHHTITIYEKRLYF